jgi:hypothetical protein
MATKNIIGFITTIKNQEILDAYALYLQNPNVRIEDKVAYNYLEDATAKLFGGIARGGSEKLQPDIIIKDSTLLNLFSEKLGITSGGQVEIETKFKRTAIAPSSVEIDSTTKDIAFQLSETTTSIGASKLSDAVRKTFKKGQLVTQAQALNANGGIGWFNLIKRKDPELYAAFYNKARFLQISYKLSNSVTALNLYTPLNRFTSPPFEMNYSKSGLKLYFNNAFEKQLLLALQNVKPLAISSLEQLRKDFDSISFGKRVNVRTSGSATLTISIPTGGSIPVTKAAIDLKSLESKSSEVKESKQSFISGVQWTALTQKRLGDTMLRLGDPEPPELKERSGRFRSSVQVTANYRTMTLQYLYNPLYASLKRYGYRPDLQIETSIRAVAQSLYSQKFNIVRRSAAL